MGHAQRELIAASSKRLRKGSLGTTLLEAAVALPAILSLVFLVIEPIIVKQRIDRVQRILEQSSNDARGDRRLYYDIWTERALTNTPEHVGQFNQARGELSSQFSNRISGVSGVTVYTVAQTLATVPGSSTVDQPLVFLAPGTSAEIKNGPMVGRKIKHKWNSDTDGDDSDDSDDSESGNPLPVGRVLAATQLISKTNSTQSLSALAESEPTEVAAAVTVKGLVRSYDTVVKIAFYPLLNKEVHLNQCRSNPQTTYGAWPASCGKISRTKTTQDGCSNVSFGTESGCNPCRQTTSGEWPTGCGNVRRTTTIQDSCLGNSSTYESRCNACTAATHTSNRVVPGQAFYPKRVMECSSGARGINCRIKHLDYLEIYQDYYQTVHYSNSCGSIWSGSEVYAGRSIVRVINRSSGLRGCFTPETRILMSDGSRRAITELRAGDLVWNPVRGRAMEIGAMIAGPESKPLREIESGGHAVRVTEGHPMLVLGGIEASDNKSDSALGGKGKPVARKAQDVVVGDMMLGADGEFYPVTAVRVLPVEAGQKVWNLRLLTESQLLEDHVIDADGVPTGDLAVQGWLERKQR